MTITAGTRLGPYEIQSPLGAGGMGEVYRARDTRLERTVAIKVLNSALVASADLKARFEREARTISQLNHPNICVLHDIGSEVPHPSGNGGPQDGAQIDFLVMEYLDGESLADRLKKGALPLEQLVRIGCEISDALDKAHRVGIVPPEKKIPGALAPGTMEAAKLGRARSAWHELRCFASLAGREPPALHEAIRQTL